jgi:hypothetical protein
LLKVCWCFAFNVSGSPDSEQRLPVDDEYMGKGQGIAWMESAEPPVAKMVFGHLRVAA